MAAFLNFILCFDGCIGRAGYWSPTPPNVLIGLSSQEADTAMYAMSRCPHRAQMYGAHVRRICAAHMWDECNPVRQTVTQTSKEADTAVQS